MTELSAPPRAAILRGWRPRLGNEALLLLLIVIVLAGFGWRDPAYLSLGTLVDIGAQTAVIGIVAFAMTAVIIGRGIDISVGSALAFAGVIGGRCYVAGGSPLLAVLAALAAGSAVGLLNGVLIGVVGISAFMATLATMALARGAALSLSDSSSIRIDSPTLLWPGGSEVAGVPTSVVIAAVLLGCWSLLLHRTVIGRWIYAVGGNAAAARASLIPVRLVGILTYVLAGLSAGAGALLTIGRLGSAQPLAGVGLEFTAITAAIIGGTKLSGGEGSVTGTALGALLLGAISTGLSFMQVPQQIIYFVTGALVLFAVLLSQRDAVMALLLRATGRRVAHAATAATAATAHTLQLQGIGKSFGGVYALRNVSFAISAGEVIALAGENGAGKSTLVKCLSGVLQPDEGSLLLDGHAARFRSPADATGISVIHQHFSLAPDLTVTESLFLGREPTVCGVLRRRAMRRRATALIAELGLSLDPGDRIGDLSVGQRQMVEIARSMLGSAWLVIMDEPTSALSQREREQLFTLTRRLRGQGCAILYISHKMDEMLALADRAVVLRDGGLVGEVPIAGLGEATLIGMMIGRSIASVFPHRDVPRGEILAEVNGIACPPLLHRASLAVRAGEVVALAGLMGSGRSAVLRCMAGLNAHTAGGVRLCGAALRPGDAQRANALGVAYVPADRLAEGLVGPMSVADNLTLAWIRRHSRAGVLRTRAMARLAEDLIRRLGVRPVNPRRPVRNLSGGNQQKVVIGKWLASTPRLLLLDEPTRGVDVGAKSEVHALIADLKAQGVGVLMVSSELPEVLGVADRIVVMHEGRVVGELARGATEAEVMALSFGSAGLAEASDKRGDG